MKNIFIIVFAILIIGIVGYFAFVKKSDLVTQQPVPAPIKTDDLTKTPSSSIPKPDDETADWETYTSNSLGFSIKYPDDAKPRIELDDQYNRLTGFGKLPGKSFEVRLYKDTDSDNGFLGADKISKDIKLGGVNGYMAVSTTGYGDAGVRGVPYVGFAAEHNGNVYYLTFKGDSIVSKEEAQILSTFKFIN